MFSPDKTSTGSKKTVVVCQKRKRSNSSSSVCKKTLTEKFSINRDYIDDGIRDSISDAFRNGKNLELENGAIISGEPYPHCVLPNFITPSGSVEKLLQKVAHMEYAPKENDLYKFHQTEDFVCSHDSMITDLRKLLYGDFLSWMSAVAGYPLDLTVDLSGSCYEYTDYLLCHNDQWDRRKIAFIYYLVPHWEESDGGTLDMFNTENEEPKDVVASIVPTNNSFVFFEVTQFSYHQVREVITDKKRIAISGWFHGDPNVLAENIPFDLKKITPMKWHVQFDSWISSYYLNQETIRCVRKKFIEDSEILLCEFLVDDKYAELCTALEKVNSWRNVGPPNKRNLEELAFSDELPSVIKDFTLFLHSEEFLIYLSSLVGIKFYNYAEMSSSSSSSSDDEDISPGRRNPSYVSRIEKWSHKSYTLLHDSDEDSRQECLDAILFFNCRDWNANYGGTISYIAKNEDSSLLDVVPTENSMSLVYREKDTMRCVKYLNHSLTEREMPLYNSISTVFYEY